MHVLSWSSVHIQVDVNPPVISHISFNLFQLTLKNSLPGQWGKIESLLNSINFSEILLLLLFMILFSFFMDPMTTSRKYSVQIPVLINFIKLIIISLVSKVLKLLYPVHHSLRLFISHVLISAPQIIIFPVPLSICPYLMNVIYVCLGKIDFGNDEYRLMEMW